MAVPDGEILTRQLAWVSLDGDGNTVVTPLSELTAGQKLDLILPDKLTAGQRAASKAFLKEKLAHGDELTDGEQHLVGKYGIALT